MEGVSYIQLGCAADDGIDDHKANLAIRIPNRRDIH
jgi:hypothetical protein